LQVSVSTGYEKSKIWGIYSRQISMDWSTLEVFALG